MSHNITLSGVKIKDLGLFGKIASELSQGRAKLVNPSSTFRTYRGQPNKCDAKLEMPGPHDVGLTKNTDGSYTPVFDPYSMDRSLKSQHGTNYIGAALQEYALQEAEYEAAQIGMTSSRVPGEKGLITLELVPTN